MAKYKVGDYVKIKSNLKEGYNADSLWVGEDMVNNYAGKIAKITTAHDGEIFESYTINIDNGDWYWSNDCFEDIAVKQLRFEIGDFVRIRSDLEIDWGEGLTPEMVELKGHLVQISNIDLISGYIDNMPYQIKELEGYYWKEEWFEYRLGNYEDNKIENRRFKYVIGYHRYEDKLETFEGFIENFYPSGKSCFIDENGKILVLPYDKIAFILPKEND